MHGLDLASSAEQKAQQSKEAEKAERRKAYPVPPEAAANFRPAVGRELVEHAMQISAAKRAKPLLSGQIGNAQQPVDCGQKEAKPLETEGQPFLSAKPASPGMKSVPFGSFPGPQKHKSIVQPNEGHTSSTVAGAGLLSSQAAQVQPGPTKVTAMDADLHARTENKAADLQSQPPSSEAAWESAQASHTPECLPFASISSTGQELPAKPQLDPGLPSVSQDQGLTFAIESKESSPSDDVKSEESAALHSPEHRRDTALKVSLKLPQLGAVPS